MIDKKINSRAKRDTCSIARYDVIEKYIVLYRKGDTMHIKVSFDLFWEIYAGEVRACSFVSPFFSTCAHARMCVLHICINHPRAPRTSQYGTRVRSLNFDPETARPFCAWPSTTGRRDTCIWHAIDGDEQMKETQHCFSPRSAYCHLRHALRF